jgi:hypothetical protein
MLYLSGNKPWLPCMALYPCWYFLQPTFTMSRRQSSKLGLSGLLTVQSCTPSVWLLVIPPRLHRSWISHGSSALGSCKQVHVGSMQGMWRRATRFLDFCGVTVSYQTMCRKESAPKRVFVIKRPTLFVISTRKIYITTTATVTKP